MLSVWALACLSCSGQTKRTGDYDVVVYGETPAGVTAAIQAATMGQRVALLSNTRRLGGIIVEGLGGTDIDNHGGFQNSSAVGGLALDFYKRIAARYGWLDELEAALKEGQKKPALWRYEPSVAEQVIADWISEFDIEVFYGARLDESNHAVEMIDRKIGSVRLQDGRLVSGKVFIDATIEGDLLAASGVTTVVGREPNAQYEESRNGIIARSISKPMRIQIDPYRVPGQPSSGVLYAITDEEWGVEGAGDHRLQAYCLRVCLTDSVENQVPFTKPANYDRDRYIAYVRYIEAGGTLSVPRSNIPGRKTDFNGGGDFSHNLFGKNYDYPLGDNATRQAVFDYHLSFTQGLLYFLSQDEEIGRLAPEFQLEWRRWGLAKDEFTDHGNWPRHFYVRDARRMVSDFVMTEHHVKKADAQPIPDPVAMAYWPPDVHSVRRIVLNDTVYNEGAVFGGNWWKPFGIAYRSLVPQADECTNLLTPTCPSSTHIAYGAIRLEWTFMALGQACGAAAAMAAEQDATVQQVDYRVLRRVLTKDGAVLEL